MIARPRAVCVFCLVLSTAHAPRLVLLAPPEARLTKLSLLLSHSGPGLQGGGACGDEGNCLQPGVHGDYFLRRARRVGEKEPHNISRRDSDHLIFPPGKDDPLILHRRDGNFLALSLERNEFQHRTLVIRIKAEPGDQSFQKLIVRVPVEDVVVSLVRGCQRTFVLSRRGCEGVDEMYCYTEDQTARNKWVDIFRRHGLAVYERRQTDSVKHDGDA